MNWLKLGGYLLIIVPTLFMGIVIGFYLIQDYMIFLGEKLPSGHHFDFKNRYEELSFQTKDDHTINALLFKVDEPKGVVLYHHGNAGNLQSWGNYAGNFMRCGYDVLFYDYRGYGKSTGRVKRQHQLHDDAEILLNHLKKRGEYRKIIYYGNSLGTGVAAKLAMDYPPDGLILESPYFNFCDLIHYHYPYLPSKIMSKYKLRTDKFIASVDCPILIFHGQDDEIVPHSSSERLSALNQKIKFVSIKNGVHNNLPEFKIYQNELGDFLNNL